MKAAIAVLAVIMSSLSISAQTTTVTNFQPQSLTLSMPCANGGKGQVVNFSWPRVRTTFHKVLVTGTGHSSLFYAGNVLAGTGSDGLRYYLGGSHDATATNWTPFNPDGSLNTDGDYRFVDEFLVTGVKVVGGPVVEQFVVRHEQDFSVTNNGINLTITFDETVCS